MTRLERELRNYERQLRNADLDFRDCSRKLRDNYERQNRSEQEAVALVRKQTSLHEKSLCLRQFIDTLRSLQEEKQA